MNEIIDSLNLVNFKLQVDIIKKSHQMKNRNRNQKLKLNKKRRNERAFLLRFEQKKKKSST